MNGYTTPTEYEQMTYEQRQAHRRKTTVDAAIERGDDIGVEIALDAFGVEAAYYYAMCPPEFRSEAATFIDEQEIELAEELERQAEIADLMWF